MPFEFGESEHLHKIGPLSLTAPGRVSQGIINGRIRQFDCELWNSGGIFIGAFHCTWYSRNRVRVCKIGFRSAKLVLAQAKIVLLSQNQFLMMEMDSMCTTRVLFLPYQSWSTKPRVFLHIWVHTFKRRTGYVSSSWWTHNFTIFDKCRWYYFNYFRM